METVVRLIGSMGLVYLPTFAINLSQLWVNMHNTWILWDMTSYLKWEYSWHCWHGQRSNCNYNVNDQPLSEFWIGGPLYPCLSLSLKQSRWKWSHHQVSNNRKEWRFICWMQCFRWYHTSLFWSVRIMFRSIRTLVLKFLLDFKPWSQVVQRTISIFKVD